MGPLKNPHLRDARNGLHWKSLTIGLFLLAVSISVAGIRGVYAPGEVYTFYTSSSRIQEYNTPGETLYINITNAAIGSRYQVAFSVRDPSGVSKNSSNSTIAASSSIVLSVVYPRDFPPGTSIGFVGNYTVNVSQSQPSNKPTVATGQFQVGLTDSKAYRRTSQILIKATGYGISENITTSLYQGSTPAIGFPQWRLADPNGNLNFSWRVPPPEPVGNYVLTLTGSSTGTKAPADTQSLSISASTVSIPGMTVKFPSISRSLTEQFILAPQYQDGQRVQTGQATIRIAESDGSNVLNATASYDNLTGTFRTAYYVPKTAITGIWIATIDPNKFDDGYGNIGPTITVSVGFNVQPAALNVSIITAAIGVRTYGPGDIIPIYASVSYPDGSSFNSGAVIARLTRNGNPVGTPISLLYIPGQQAWAGTYQVASNDPSGIWLITVDASDQIGESGEGTYSAAVSVPPSSQSNWLNTSTFLLITAIIAGAILAVLFWALLIGRRRFTRRQVKLDMRVIDKEVEKIQDTQFFQDIKKQVEEKRPPAADPPQGDKPDH